MTNKNSDFEGLAYLEEYFLDINEEYAGLYSFWCSALTNAPPGPALDIGVGPTLYSTIPLASQTRIIHVADLVSDAMRQIDMWLNRKANHFDWKKHIRLILLTEGANGTDAEVQLREETVKTATNCSFTV